MLHRSRLENAKYYYERALEASQSGEDSAPSHKNLGMTLQRLSETKDPFDEYLEKVQLGCDALTHFA